MRLPTRKDRNMADTPKPMQGTWTLTAPDGRTWQAESPLRVVALESRERVPATVALQRIYAAADEPTELENVLTAALQQIADMDPAGHQGCGTVSLAARHAARGCRCRHRGERRTAGLSGSPAGRGGPFVLVPKHASWIQ